MCFYPVLCTVYFFFLVLDKMTRAQPQLKCQGVWRREVKYKKGKTRVGGGFGFAHVHRGSTHRGGEKH